MTGCHISEGIWLIKNKLQVLFWGFMVLGILGISVRNSARRGDKLITPMPGGVPCSRKTSVSGILSGKKQSMHQPCLCREQRAGSQEPVIDKDQ